MDDLLGYPATRAGRTLAVTIRGDFSARVAERFAERCLTLPRDVQALVLDLSDVDLLDEASVGVLRALTDAWRGARDGGAHLLFTTAGIMAAYRPAAIPAWRPRAPGDREARG